MSSIALNGRRLLDGHATCLVDAVMHSQRDWRGGRSADAVTLSDFEHAHGRFSFRSALLPMRLGSRRRWP
jgi:hypothetical protein